MEGRSENRWDIARKQRTKEAVEIKTTLTTTLNTNRLNILPANEQRLSDWLKTLISHYMQYARDI